MITNIVIICNVIQKLEEIYFHYKLLVIKCLYYYSNELNCNEYKVTMTKI